MAHAGGPTFDPRAAAALRQKTQRRRALGALALVVGAAALALLIQGRRIHRQPEADEPGGPSMAAQLQTWASQSGPKQPAVEGDDVLPFGGFYEQAERDVQRAIEAEQRAERSLEQAENAGVDRGRLDELRKRLAGEVSAPPVLSTERAL